MNVAIVHKETGAVLAKGEGMRFEGYWYFRPEDVASDRLTVTGKTYTCPYKGTCNWVACQDDPQVAWVYPNPREGFENIQGKFGFYPGDHGATEEIN